LIINQSVEGESNEEFITQSRIEGGGGETATTNLGNGLDFRAQFVLDAVQGKAIFVRDQVDGNAQVTKPTRTTDSMQVRLGHLRKIEIDDHIDSLNVDTTSKQV
jgi:hypothetical protein